MTSQLSYEKGRLAPNLQRRGRCPRSPCNKSANSGSPECKGDCFRTSVWDLQKLSSLRTDLRLDRQPCLHENNPEESFQSKANDLQEIENLYGIWALCLKPISMSVARASTGACLVTHSCDSGTGTFLCVMSLSLAPCLTLLFI